LTANVSILEESGNALHTQKGHDELVLILEGEVDFRVGEETRRVQPGDLVFIAKNTLHGPILRTGGRFAALSVFAPVFDRTKHNIEWQRETSR
jgi:quercetin dioxygenase-like cupin family protein